MAKRGAEVRVSRIGPSGRPMAEVLVDKNISATDLGAMLKKVTRDKDLLRAVGLKACSACKSGLDVFIRDRFEKVITIGG